MEAIDTWQLRTVVDRHTCSREHKLGLFNAKWLSKKLEKIVKENPNVKGVDIRDKISRKWNIAISKNMAYKAKAYASDEVEGSFTMQYSRIYDYAHELLARNPGSTIKIKVPIIGLDGAFLKGRHRGELLTTVARDANDQMMPLAYAIVEVENKETWTWKKFIGKNLKKLMWRAATTTHPQKWENEMRSIREVNEDAFRHLIAIPPSWSAQKLFEVRHVSQTGDNCVHALASMRFLNLNEEDYIHVCFLTSTYEEMYFSIIYPINGNNLWEVTQHPDVIPPSKRKMHGRPKKKRRLEQWELKKNSTRMSKGGLVKRCSKCREVGHIKTRYPKRNEQNVLQSQGEEPTSLA
ncbi:uncharacterized protein LOC124840599 [Vigna umbellata]|uniref:uncharacterized protein LOC124840599 n=1 Tax=Vigna umbellata TaxID=87088 RepID=UPI001F5FDA0E|nr:uncharacterized protein LOC124840599 [Vigna umbellata]